MRQRDETIKKDRKNDPSLSLFTEKNSFAVVTSVRNHNI